MDAAEELVAAIKAKDAAVAKALLAKEPALANARVSDGMSVLRFALYARDSLAVDALLAAGAEPDVWDSATMGDLARVRAWLAKDRALAGAMSPDGSRPLHLAAHFGHVDVVRALLDAGAALAEMSGPFFGNTALHAAAAGGRDEVVELLVMVGAPVDARDKNGFTPLHVAAAGGSARAVRFLLSKGAQRDAKGGDGRAAIDFARERGFGEVVALLQGPLRGAARG